MTSTQGPTMPAAFNIMHARRMNQREHTQPPRAQEPHALQYISPEPLRETKRTALEQRQALWHRKSASLGQIGIAFSSPDEARALQDHPLTAEETDSLLDGVLDLYHETGDASTRHDVDLVQDIQRLSLPETLKDEGLTSSSTRSTPPTSIPGTVHQTEVSQVAPVQQPPSQRDRYGFRCESQHVSLEDYNAWQARYEEHLVRRHHKWDTLLNETLQANTARRNGSDMEFPARSAKLQRYVRKGIPPEYRGQAWFHYANGHACLSAHPGLYHRLAEQARRLCGDGNNDLIERDLHRTFPDNIHFKPDGYTRTGQSANATAFQEEPPMIASLRRVLQAFALYRPQVGYCQSLNFIAALFLLFMPEERAFWMLVITTTDYLPHVHDANLEGANVDQAVLMLAVRECLPSIWLRLGQGFETPSSPHPGTLSNTSGGRDGLGFRRPSLGKQSPASSGTKATPHEIIGKLPPITLVTAAWFMSAFIGILPIETTLRVWDCLFYEGSKVLFRIALTILKQGERSILAVSDPIEIFQVVQTLPRQMIDAGALMEACFKRRNGVGHLSQKEVDARRQKVAAIRGRQAATVLASQPSSTTSVVEAPPKPVAREQMWPSGSGAIDLPRRSRDDLALVTKVIPTRKLSGSTKIRSRFFSHTTSEVP